MNTKHWTDLLVRLNACPEAVEWARGYRSLAAAWAACERGDWMLWLAARLSGRPGSKSRRLVVLAAADCAATALQYVREGETRPAKCVGLCQRYGRGDAGVTLAQVSAAWADAGAAWADAWAGVAWAAEAAEAAALHDHADIVRGHYPRAPRAPRARRVP